MIRIGIGGLWHETNTFTPHPTEIEDFHRFQFLQGQDIIRSARGTNTELGGAIDEAERLGVKVVPLHYAAAVPSGMVSRGAFQTLVASQLEALRKSGDLDGLLLALHGAMVVDGTNVPEAALVHACRAFLGTHVPVAATLDLHGNLTDELSDGCDVVIAYDTFPHVDMAERGAEAMRLLVRMIKESIRPAHTHIKIPLITVPQCQATSEHPLSGVIELVHRVEKRPGVWTASVLPGYPYCDVAALGFSVYVCGETPWREAQELGAYVWRQRRNFAPSLLSPEAAIAEIDRSSGSVALVDVADNVGGGSPGNGTVILAALQNRKQSDNAAVIWAPNAINSLYEDRQRTTVVVGGDPHMGPAVTLSGAVRLCGRLGYERTGRYMSGQHVDMGRCAVVETRGGLVLLTEYRVMPFDEDHLRSAGIDPSLYKVLVVKSATAWRLAVGQYVSRAIYVRTPGYCPSELETLEFKVRPVPAFPFEPDTTWGADA